MWWFLYGFIMGAGVMRVVIWVKAQGAVVNWYVWLMGAFALFLITLTIQHFFASFEESEPKAAWVGLMVMGDPSFFLAGMALWLILTA